MQLYWPVSRNSWMKQQHQWWVFLQVVGYVLYVNQDILEPWSGVGFSRLGDVRDELAASSTHAIQCVKKRSLASRFIHPVADFKTKSSSLSSLFSSFFYLSSPFGQLDYQRPYQRGVLCSYGRDSFANNCTKVLKPPIPVGNNWHPLGLSFLLFFKFFIFLSIWWTVLLSILRQTNFIFSHQDSVVLASAASLRNQQSKNWNGSLRRIQTRPFFLMLGFVNRFENIRFRINGNLYETWVPFTLRGNSIYIYTDLMDIVHPMIYILRQYKRIRVLEICYKSVAQFRSS